MEGESGSQGNHKGGEIGRYKAPFKTKPKNDQVAYDKGWIGRQEKRDGYFIGGLERPGIRNKIEYATYTNEEKRNPGCQRDNHVQLGQRVLFQQIAQWHWPPETIAAGLLTCRPIVREWNILHSEIVIIFKIGHDEEIVFVTCYSFLTNSCWQIFCTNLPQI